MSEYQLHEFQSIDRTLTPADRQYLEGLSSRVEVTATSARFNYSYGDFRGDPLKVLERCFDILLYQANFGVLQLAIRLPKEVAVSDLYEPYCIPYGISVSQTKQAADAERRRIEALGGPKVEGLWVKVSGLVRTGQAKKYDEAVRQVKKLRAIAEKDNKLNAFYARLTEVKEQFSRKKSFISRLDEVGL